MTVEDKQKAWQDRYRNGFFLAPMVRIGTLPMRLLSLKYGADLVWTPEIVDLSIIGCERQVISRTGVISYIKGGKDVFTTHPDEKEKVIFQLGSAQPETALAAAKIVEQDVSGFDLNCGCPKRFSVQGSMGAALLSDPDRLCSILETLVQNVSVPVTCKIRVFDDEEKTLELVRRIAKTGISALTVHCRTKNMRPREKALWHRLRSIVDEIPHLPVVLNGDIFKYEDIQRAKDLTGATSVMTARGAAANPSIFRSEGMIDTMEAVIEYAKLAVRTWNIYYNTKYTLLQMYPHTKSQQYVVVRNSKTYKALCESLGLEEFYREEGVNFAKITTDVSDKDIKSTNTSPQQTPKKRCASSPEPLLLADGDRADNEFGSEAPAKRVKD
ncbi:tRNA-dihydrouridine synthase 2 [Coemansia sp. RSA 1813]|nr:tRNA-dihydrouridine synthase 2 [Coemansia sp. RSA 1646]KAJ1766406.1 tRNA-dihydrouridine synthase 2 [Coemansia sp. RSA 1843]KAJ2088589.1 tRNA-dihydrouridine synthase 2 [Coemansia sp. RSA 986]KAJ2212208.1 tRNA-dihydrouridine synthase 2 [Coemansia sp. RSA 487]KAJ2568391.1 tRNA-dihydrouridine synthase 2 [Coemansia sp. RSA 1813]